MSTNALASLVWQLIIAVDDVNLANYGTIDAKRARHVAAVDKCLQWFAGGLLVDEDVDVDLWRYRVYSERAYVANLCAFTAEDFAPWRRRYIVHADALCLGRTLIVAQFQFMSRADSTYWNSHFRSERLTLSVLGRLVPYHLKCCCKSTETARDRLLVRIPPEYDRLNAFQGFLFEQ